MILPPSKCPSVKSSNNEKKLPKVKSNCTKKGKLVPRFFYDGNINNLLCEQSKHDL